MAGKLRSQRLEEKRRRRERRLEKRRRFETQALDAGDARAIESCIEALEAVADIPQPSHWPGASDPSVSRPDRIKFDIAQPACGQEPGRSKLKAFELRCGQGPLRALPELDHWVMEEFIWHGAPGHELRPVDAFLAREGHRFPQAAREQLRRWKEARIGAFEVGATDGATVRLRPWDLVASAPSGPELRAISLNIGGVNAYRGLEGHITVMYVAPWAPDQGISCAMGYGMTLPKRRSAILVLPLGFAHPAVVARPFPWAESAWAAREHLSLWELRDWQGWLADRLQFPFPALVPDLSSGELAIATVAGILRVSADEARRQGIHFDCRLGGSALTLGATALTPCDIASPNAALLAEYHAYRERVGPPPDHYRPAPRLLLPGGPREWRRE